MKLSKFAVLIATAVTCSQAFAANGAQIYTPVVNEAGILGLHSSSYGESSKLGLGLNYNLAIDPLEVGDSRGKLENYLHSWNLGVGSKIHDRFHLFADFSIHTIAPTGADLNRIIKNDSDIVFGNIKTGIGFSLLDTTEGGLGVGVIPHVVIPVGSDNAYLEGPTTKRGERAWQYGATLAVDHKVVHKDHLLLNVGYDRRLKESYLTWGLGYQSPIFGGDTHNVLFELRGETSLNDPKTPDADPLEANLAYKGYCMERRGSYVVGVGRGFNNNAGSPDLRVMLGLNWQLDHAHAVAAEPAAAPAQPVPEVAAPVVAPPAPAPVPAVAAAPVVVGVSTLKVSTIYFANNKDTILAKSNAGLDKLAADLKDNPGLKKLGIEGYTDSIGNPDYNKTLSQRRAESVKTYLAAKGIDAGRLTATGMGAENPIADNKTATGRAANRRVEFRILEVDGNIKMDLSN